MYAGNLNFYCAHTERPTNTKENRRTLGLSNSKGAFLKNGSDSLISSSHSTSRLVIDRGGGVMIMIIIK